MCSSDMEHSLPIQFPPKVPKQTKTLMTKPMPLGKPATSPQHFPQPTQVPSFPLTPASRSTRVLAAWKENSDGCSTWHRVRAVAHTILERRAWQSCVSCTSRQGPSAVTVPGNQPCSQQAQQQPRTRRSRREPSDPGDTLVLFSSCTTTRSRSCGSEESKMLEMLA